MLFAFDSTFGAFGLKFGGFGFKLPNFLLGLDAGCATSISIWLITSS